jgi:16S rRNA processing protein RimM
LNSVTDRLESETFEAGILVKVHGVNGRLVVRLNQPAADITDFPEWLFIRIDGGLVPFSIAEESVFQKDANHIVVGLLKISGPEEAAGFIGKTVNLEGEWSEWFETGEAVRDSLTGYTLADVVSGLTGTVSGFEDIPGNPLLEIEINGKRALLPLNPEFIVKTDHKARSLVLRIPDGLLDL